MTKWKRVLVASFVALLVVFSCLAAGQNQEIQKQALEISLDQKPPIDPHITVGELKNGLRYYVRENGQPENRAELRLVVNAGSMQEDDDQLGLAHFVEHMAFNGTEHFAKHELVEFMESIGMRFGPGLNAMTSFDETIYMLRIPTDSPDVMKTAFQILEDWSHGLSFEHEEIDKERAVIIEEWRLGQGADARMLDKQFPILFKGSLYAERLPIGKKDIIENFKYETLKRFYKDWYRPNLMAVIAVGDFDKIEVEALIKDHFDGLVNPSNPRPRVLAEVPDYEETLTAIATDKETSSTSVSVYFKLPLRQMETVGALRQMIVENMYNGMLNQRFSEIAQKPDSPFLAAFSGRGLFVRSKEVYNLTALVDEKKIKDGLEALFVESERVAGFGFTQSELDRQKINIIRSLERAFAEREKSQSASFASEYIRNFLEGEPIPGIEYEFELYRRFVPEITLKDINRLGKEWITGRNRVILVNAPEKEGLVIPTEEELLDVLVSASDKEIKPYEDIVTDEPLLAEIPQPGIIVSTTRLENMGITEWELSNGVRVVLKPTDFKDDEILFRALSPGGTSLAEDEDYIPASIAAQIISMGGLRNFTAIDLQKKLSGKVVRVTPFISELEEGLSGSSSPKDLETMFQLIYLTFTAPRADADIFKVMVNQMTTVLKNRDANPMTAFQDTLQSTLSQNHFRTRPFTIEAVEQMDLEKSYAFYKDRFADAGDFTFLFIGNIDLEIMKPLVERYLGALPTVDRKEFWKDVGIDSPKGVIKKSVYKGIEPKSQTSFVFTGPFQYDSAHRTAIRAMGMVFETRLREVLREDLGGTYGVSVSPVYEKIPEAEYSISISFGSDPQRVEELVKVIFQEIEKLKTNVSLDEVNDAREALYRSTETGLKQNGWLLAQLVYKYRQGDDPNELLLWEEPLKLLSPEVIMEAAREYFNMDNYVLVSLFPEKTIK
jgi:zinc protease